MRGLAVVLLALALVACSPDAVRVARYQDRFVELAGASLRLNRPLPIQPGTARVFIQHGQVLGSGIGDQYQPQCDFEVRDLSDKVQTIEPDTFLIDRVQQVTEQVVMLRPAVLASLGNMFDQGDSSYFEGYHFWLTSPTQPEVMRMTCIGAFAASADVHFPTLAEIREVLGPVAQIIGVPQH